MATRGNSVSKFFVWALLMMLVVGLAGFGATNLSGNIQNIGKVGNKEITVNEYARALQNELDATERQFGQRLTLQQAQAFGIDQRVIARLVMEKALDHEADMIELSVGDSKVRDELINIGAFQGIDGSFDRETYRFALQNAGLKEAEFEEQLRTEASRTLLQAAILSGIPSNDAYVDTVMAFLLEERSFQVVRFDENNLTTEIATASEAELEAFYQANIAEYTLPESKRITYAKLTPDMLIDQIDVEDAAVNDLYEARSEDYNRPEKRIVERLPFLDMATASEALARVTSGDVTFDAIVEERGLALSDIDMGDVSQADLGSAAEAVFAAELGAIAGPIETDLGPALFRVNAILAAETTPFDEVEQDLRDELALERARRQLENQSSNIDNLLAAGATLEELVAEADMVVSTLDYYAGVEDDIAGYAAFNEEAAALSENDFPQVMQLDDGGIFAMRLDEIVAPRPQEFESVRGDVEAAWRDQTMMDALIEQANAFAQDANETDLAEQTKSYENMTRGDFLDDLPPAILASAFEIELGAKKTVEGADAVYVVVLDSIDAGKTDTSDADAMRVQIENQLGSSLAQDLFDAYATQIRQRVGIELDQAAINAVHANFQ